ncbi:hypothetical protein BKA69DRAFT_1073768 [Paraphysoderma sedebokerense]|nr:hypothetical protein BKA69DRAFT_1073768 [Paraphysoderma sedebokerense]
MASTTTNNAKDNYFSHQVAGHDSLLSHPEDSTRLLKPCHPKETSFYLYLQSVPTHPLKPLIPTFYGTTNLPRALTDDEKKRGITDCIVLENLLVGFKKGCVMDIKLGTKLYEDDANEEKKKKMIKLSQETTNGIVGMRVSGMKVYDPASSKFQTHDKAFGKSLTAATIHQCWPEFVRFVPAHLRVPLLKSFLAECKKIRTVISQIRGGFVGTSFLFVFEGDSIEGNENATEVKSLVKLIDFAHSKIYTEGEKGGVEEHLLFGMDNVISSLERVISGGC